MNKLNYVVLSKGKMYNKEWESKESFDTLREAIVCLTKNKEENDEFRSYKNVVSYAGLGSAFVFSGDGGWYRSVIVTMSDKELKQNKPNPKIDGIIIDKPMNMVTMIEIIANTINKDKYINWGEIHNIFEEEYAKKGLYFRASFLNNWANNEIEGFDYQRAVSDEIKLLVSLWGYDNYLRDVVGGYSIVSENGFDELKVNLKSLLDQIKVDEVKSSITNLGGTLDFESIFNK